MLKTCSLESDLLEFDFDVEEDFDILRVFWHRAASDPEQVSVEFIVMDDDVHDVGQRLIFSRLEHSQNVASPLPIWTDSAPMNNAIFLNILKII